MIIIKISLIRYKLLYPCVPMLSLLGTIQATAAAAVCSVFQFLPFPSGHFWLLKRRQSSMVPRSSSSNNNHNKAKAKARAKYI